MRQQPVAERLMAHSIPEPNTGCWLWLGSLCAWGYGKFVVGGRTRTVHRVSYEEFVGPIMPGLVLDHLCRCRSCINPAHLEQVTPRENTLRGVSFAAEKHRQAHCIHGHPLSGGNLYLMPDGRRACRACRRFHSQNYKRARLARQREAC